MVNSKRIQVLDLLSELRLGSTCKFDLNKAQIRPKGEIILDEQIKLFSVPAVKILLGVSSEYTSFTPG